MSGSNSKCMKMCCGICSKTIAKNHRHILCENCNEHVHITCNQTDAKAYKKIILDKIPQTCLKCQTNNLPFQNLPDSHFIAVNQNITIPASTVAPSKPKCKVCTKTIAVNHRKITCQSCQLSVHI